mgnify:CR=1 FL=1
MKTGKMSNVDKEYITNNLDKGVDKLSKKLNRTPESIQKFIDSLQEEQKTKVVDVTNLYGKSKTAVIMTQALSETMDEVSKKTPKSSRFDPSCVITIKR